MNSSPKKHSQTFEGVVERGGQFARTLGYPTVNIALSDASYSGSYAGVVLYKGISHNAGLYADPERHLLEAHMFDFSEDMYGETVSITILDKIREREAFSDLEALKKAIRGDMEAARAFFDKNTKISKI